ncbi:MAG: DUF4159 domain-containing protein [Candidatus Latescibacterota bacterium]
MRHTSAHALDIVERNWRLFGAGVALSVLAHLLVFGAWVLPHREVEEEVVAFVELQYEKTAFAVTPPRLARDFAFRKQAVPQGAPVVSARTQRTTTVVGGGRLGPRAGAPASRLWSSRGGSADFRVDVSGPLLGDGLLGTPQFESVAIASMKEPERRIDMQAEFLDLESIDTGKYKGMVIQDPTDKRNVSGFVYLALASGSVLRPSRQRAIIQLVRAINTYTSIRAEVDDQLFLDSQDLFRAPFVYITTSTAFELTRHEAQNLGSYLRSGGFAVADNDQPQLEYGPAEASLRAMFKDALGRDARFVQLGSDHPLYRVFFDFEGGPPPGGEASSLGPNRFTGKASPVPYLEGIYLGNRLVAVYSDKGYGAFWEREFENEPHLKMGVNLVVFALTQKGSIAEQQIDFYHQAGRQ